MARITRTFEIEEHREFGNIGLAPTWMSGDQSDPLTGMGVAHDVLEHGDSDQCEWQGLGGAVWVRAVNGYFSRRGRGNPDPVENIASDFVQLFYLWEGEDIPDPGRTYPVDDDDSMIVDVVTRGCALVVSEMGYSANADSEMKRVRHWTRTEQRRRMIGWMRRGYRAAAKRWKRYSGYQLEQTFRAIEAAVDRFLTTEGADYQGAKVDLVFDIENESASLHLVDEPYDY